MPLADARAMLPALVVANADEPADRLLLEKIADWCVHFTPLVALDPPHGLLLDVTGVTHLFDGEQALLDRSRTSLRRTGIALCRARLRARPPRRARWPATGMARSFRLAKKGPQWPCFLSKRWISVPPSPTPFAAPASRPSGK